MSKFIKWFMIAMLAVAFTGCGGGGTTAQAIAQAKIVAYAQSNGVGVDVPTVEDYAVAGVTGVTETNLLAMNKLVKDSTAEGVDTLAEVQTLADGLGSPDNNPPIATPQSVTMDEDTAKSITLAGTDADGDTLVYTIVTQPTKGTLTGTAPNVTYTPNADYSGADSFAFKVFDGTVDSSSATVSITVNDVAEYPPSLANPTDQSVEENATVSTLITTIETNGTQFRPEHHR